MAAAHIMPLGRCLSPPSCRCWPERSPRVFRRLSGLALPASSHSWRAASGDVDHRPPHRLGCVHLGDVKGRREAPLPHTSFAAGPGPVHVQRERGVESGNADGGTQPSSFLFQSHSSAELTRKFEGSPVLFFSSLLNLLSFPIQKHLHWLDHIKGCSGLANFNPPAFSSLSMHFFYLALQGIQRKPSQTYRGVNLCM